MPTSASIGGTKRASIVSTTCVLESERYPLSPPNLHWPSSVRELTGKLADAKKVQSVRKDQTHESTMVSHPVTLTRVSNASVYLTGGRHLIRTADGEVVSQHRVDTQRQSEIPWQTHKHLSGTSLILGDSAGAQIYYHWMLDLLPKLGYLSKANIDLNDIDHFLVRHARSALHIKTLKHLGIDSSRIVETANHPYFTCDDVLHMKLTHTISMTMNRFVPNWIKQTYGATDSIGSNQTSQTNGLSELNNSDQSNTSKVSDSDERIKLYIQRPEGAGGSIRNECELMAMLKDHGFHVTTMQGLSIYEQAVLLEKTETLVAAHGSALTNMVFANAGMNVIELFGPHIYPYYRGLANLCKHQYHAVLQSQSDCTPLLDLNIAIQSGTAENQAATRHEGFSVDVDVVDNILKSLK